MNRKHAELIQALRRGDKKAVHHLLRSRVLEFRMVCQHCGESSSPLGLKYDFGDLAVNVECSLCGRPNRLAMKDWDPSVPLQLPPLT